MSDFSKEKLYEIYNNNLPIFLRLAQISSKEKVELNLTIFPNGLIHLESKEHLKTRTGKEAVRIHHIEQAPNKVGDGSETMICYGEDYEIE